MPRIGYARSGGRVGGVNIIEKSSSETYS